MQTLTFQVYMCHFFNQLVEFSARGGGFTIKGISHESVQLPLWGCKQSRGPPIVTILFVATYLAQTQIKKMQGKLWCVHLLHLTIFTTSLFLTSSFANTVY